MHDSRTWLRLGTTCLGVSFVATLLMPNGDTIIGNRTTLVADSWIEHATFWLGIVFIAGYVVERILEARRDGS